MYVGSFETDYHKGNGEVNIRGIKYRRCCIYCSESFYSFFKENGQKLTRVGNMILSISNCCQPFLFINNIYSAIKVPEQNIKIDNTLILDDS